RRRHTIWPRDWSSDVCSSDLTALGRAVAGRDVPAAGWIGAIAANAPDWSELVLKPDLWPPRAGGEYLVFHRGITHSFVGAVVERSEERRVGKERGARVWAC